MHKNLRLIYITTESEKQAKTLGKKIVGTKLAACANIIPKMTSIYRWEGKLQEDNEAILILKTHVSKVQEITEYVNQNHTYDCPCVISINITEDEGNEAYLNWLVDESKSELK